MFSGHLLALLDVIFDVTELLFEVVKALQGPSDFLLLALVDVHGTRSNSQHPCVAHSMLGVRAHLLILFLLVSEFELDTDFAKGLVLEHHDWLGEMDLAKVHLDCICEKGHLLLVLARSLHFFLIIRGEHISLAIEVRSSTRRFLSLVNHFLISTGTEGREVT